MKIIHCSDLHLDSKMQTNFAPQQAKIRQNEIVKTFARLCEYATKNKVEAILICGDMFDTVSPSASVVEYCVSLIKATETEFYVIYGNHDERDIFSNISLPNLHVFDDKWKTYQQGQVTISGTNALPVSFDSLQLPADKVNVVMLHGQETSYDGVADGINILSAKGKNINYLALGHLHTHRVNKIDESGVYAYSGCLEGRGFDECGEKGFMLLDISPKGFKHRFVKFGLRTLHEVKVNISNIEDYYSIESTVASAVAHIEQQDIVRIVLCGTYTVNTRKDIKMLQELVSNRFFYCQIIDQTKLYVDKSEYENALSLKGEFIRLVYAADLPEQEKEQIIVTGLRALAGEVEE